MWGNVGVHRPLSSPMHGRGSPGMSGRLSPSELCSLLSLLWLSPIWSQETSHQNNEMPKLESRTTGTF